MRVAHPRAASGRGRTQRLLVVRRARLVGRWTGVRSATIEKWSAAALGLPALSCDAPAAMSTVTVPEAAGVIVTTINAPAP